MPANCRGLEYGRPILMPTKAEDHSKQAIMARNEVLKIIFLKTISFQHKIDHYYDVKQISLSGNPKIILLKRELRK